MLRITQLLSTAWQDFLFVASELLTKQQTKNNIKALFLFLLLLGACANWVKAQRHTFYSNNIRHLHESLFTDIQSVSSEKSGPTIMVLMYTHFISVRTVQSLAPAERRFIYSDFIVLGCMLLYVMASYGVEVTSAFPNNRYTRTSCNQINN